MNEAKRFFLLRHVLQFISCVGSQSTITIESLAGTRACALTPAILPGHSLAIQDELLDFRKSLLYCSVRLVAGEFIVRERDGKSRGVLGSVEPPICGFPGYHVGL